MLFMYDDYDHDLMYEACMIRFSQSVSNFGLVWLKIDFFSPSFFTKARFFGIFFSWLVVWIAAADHTRTHTYIHKE